MYLSRDAVRKAIRELQKRSHPFVGISFLACKKAGLPVGSSKGVSLDRITKSHLEQHHRLDPQSVFYFQPFKSSKPWVVQKYPSAGLQSINTRTFGSALVHEKKRKSWGFRVEYIEQIGKIVEGSSGYGPVPLSAIAIWIGKERMWAKDASLSTVVDLFLADYDITRQEKEALFGEHDATVAAPLFEADPVDLRVLAHEFGLPPDAPGETQGVITSLQLVGIGPAKRFDLEFGDRLTLIAGDNGLGKTFLLDAAWWALTGRWAGRQAIPTVGGQDDDSSIRYEVRYPGNRKETVSSCFDKQNQTWRGRSQEGASLSALCLYARVDGSIAVSDEIRGSLRVDDRNRLDVFTSDEVWDGRIGGIEGLVRDWANWQLSHDEEDEKDAYSTLVQILEHLSSEDLGTLEPGTPRRLPGDLRTIPTIQFAYGDVPILMSSAGVQRILALAYLVTWAWQEHVIAARQVQREPVRKMVLLIDEVEAHLHPRWQRFLLPALITIGKLLSEDLEVQMIAATHSPLILASVETEFSSDADVLYHLALRDQDVILEALDYQKYGDSSSWLTSPVFGLRHARSRQAEEAIEKAKRIQFDRKPGLEVVRSVTKELRRCLSADDSFWPRWIYFARRVGEDI